MPSPLSVVIHGHFYQPPREDPWLEMVEVEPSAAPAHDWNARIEQECYRAVAAARVPGRGGRIRRIINTLEWTSFNFGPTLLEWLEHQAPATYAAVLEADRHSMQRLGHGNAIAMPYHHAILPLSTLRQKIMEVRWGIADFRRRFGREPEGMWLPETAVDEETLEVLAGEGIRFTILAPHQVVTLPPRGLPAVYRTRSSGTIALCLYDGAMSHDVAFGPLVRDADLWVRRVLASRDGGARVVSVATDGETYGHHHTFGEMALALTLEQLKQEPELTVENFASLLAGAPATHETELVSPSAWSCVHGVERWRSDCGCRIGTDRPTQQQWRTPLREGLAWLTAELHALVDREAPLYFSDPEEARDDYGSVVGAAPELIRTYVTRRALLPHDADALVRAAELLELERGALRSLTSCAWFFDDLARIETLQVLRYAAWAIERSGAEAARLEEGLLGRLATAESNDPAMGNGSDIYLQRIKPRMSAEARIATGIVALERFAPERLPLRSHMLRHEGDGIVLERRRTGRRFRGQIELERQGLAIFATATGPTLPEPLQLGLDDLPETAREGVQATLRAKVLARTLSPAERAALAAGSGLTPVVRQALARAVETLADDRSADAIQQVIELRALLGQLGETVPFDVQTMFYRLWRGATSDERALATVARELGFEARSGGVDVRRG